MLAIQLALALEPTVPAATRPRRTMVARDALTVVDIPTAEMPAPPVRREPTRTHATRRREMREEMERRRAAAMNAAGAALSRVHLVRAEPHRFPHLVPLAERAEHLATKHLTVAQATAKWISHLSY